MELIGAAAMIACALCCVPASAQAQTRASSHQAAGRSSGQTSLYKFMDTAAFPQEWHAHARASANQSKPAAPSKPAARPSAKSPSARPASRSTSTSSTSLYAFMDTVGYPEPYKAPVSHTGSGATRRSTGSASRKTTHNRSTLPPGYVEVK